MTSESQVAALVALLRAGRRPSSTYAELVETADGAVPVLEDEHGLLAGQLLESAASDVAKWRQEGITLLTVLDPDYPANLRAVHDRPPLIFVAGRLLPEDRRSVAVIGSRKPPNEGVARAGAIASELVDRGYTVASGLAAGIDTAAHTSALARGGRTIAVIGTGLSRAYPPQNASLQRQIADRCAVVSQFWPDAAPTRISFPLRNAVMSGLALATIVVEASHMSGARTQARIALAHGRPVLLMDALLSQQWARDLARRAGAHVVGSAAEVSSTVERLSSTGTLVA